ncbi:hypothetical protein [Mesonia oceanica]|uniref:Uncharacterized protein n=1 Tax=Mesonia oceanica TaxID=2687242 RepID=A0AC61Y6E7_9FLAO|nr:hypothetical protein [Mesonia oceanica]VVU99467.1 hypothetical protein FVB9532_00721 [Mesonia oceanica]|tara:strand:+ start:24405 stop:24578 length:174 start_codon:yes stop_codon:yes gene_type:complete
MLTFFIILGALLILNIFIFIFSRNKVEETGTSKAKKANYEQEVRKTNTSTIPQVQDA